MSNEMKLIMESWRSNLSEQQNALQLVKQYTKQQKQKKQINEALGLSGLIGGVIWLAAKLVLSEIIFKGLALISKKIGFTGLESVLNVLSEGMKFLSRKMSTFLVAPALKYLINTYLIDGQQKQRALKSVDEIEKFLSFVILLSYFSFEIYDKIEESGDLASYVTGLADKFNLSEGIPEFIETLDDVVNVAEISYVSAEARSSKVRASVVREVIDNSERIWKSFF